jgi:hypothetical protein
VVVIGTIFRSVWWVYDHFFKPVFGDGERTQPTKESTTPPTTPPTKEAVKG